MDGFTRQHLYYTTCFFLPSFLNTLNPLISWRVFLYLLFQSPSSLDTTHLPPSAERLAGASVNYRVREKKSSATVRPTCWPVSALRPHLLTGMPKALARPKSASFSSPSRLMSRFCGFRSRCRLIGVDR